MTRKERVKLYMKEYRKTQTYKENKKKSDAKYYEKNKNDASFIDTRKNYYNKNKEIIMNNVIKWQKNNVDKVKQYKKKNEIKFSRKYYIKKKYGLTLEQYDEMANHQNGLCAICNSQCTLYDKLSIDHCHETGKVRELLCNSCNIGIANFKENVEYLKAAILYLEKHKCQK